MRKIVFLLGLVLFISVISCGNKEQKTKESLVLIKTGFGNIKVKLYNDTPEHKANFLKLAGEGFYNDLLFHRVIKNFMIQGGDPESKNAEPGKRLGGGSLGYTIPAEILPNHFHKRGVLAAARNGGPSNPEKRSSASQFYIVQGESFTAGKLDTLEMMVNKRRRDMLFRTEMQKQMATLNEFKANNDHDGFNIFVADMSAKVDSIFNAGEKFKIDAEKREVYQQIGGYPSLDGDYTVFGEVVEGMEVVDKIAEQETDKYNRPVNDVKMQVEILK